MTEPQGKSATAPSKDKRPSEYEQLETAKVKAAQLEALLSLTSPVKGMGALSGFIDMSAIQLHHALIPKEAVIAGQGKDFQESFDTLYKSSSLPKVERPTPVGLFMVEDSPKNVDEKHPFVHGHGVTAYGMAASKAISGQEYPVQLINRVAFESNVGSHWTKKPSASGASFERHYMPDLAHGFLKSDFDKNGVNVVSVSMVAINHELQKPSDRVAGTDKIRDYFGNNTVFMAGSGNGETKANPSFRHNALRNNPDTLLVGAANAMPTMDASGKAMHAYSVTEYSASGPDVLMVATPPGARYAKNTPEGLRFLPQHGTSSATPQAAAAVAQLMRRFVTNKENPDALLSKEDVLLAVKNTAQPVHSVIHDRVSYAIEKADAPEHRSGRDVTPLRMYEVGGKFVSLQAGNGMLDVKSAWELLEKQEKAVRDGKAKALPRKDVKVTLTPSEHILATATDRTRLPEGAPAGLYSYKIDVKDALNADQIILDITSLSLSRKMNKEAPASRPRVFLANPAGEILEVIPSSGFNRATDNRTGIESDLESPLSIARVAGMQGSAMKGTWTVLSTEKLDGVTANFDRAMSPDHVGVKIVPDAETRKKTLYRQADFTSHTPAQLDAMFTKDSPMLNYDLSEAGFPPHYTDIKLARLAEQDKVLAQKLLNARYGNAKNKDELTKAIESGDGGKVLDALVPEKERFTFFRDMAETGSKESILFLIEKGYATVKDENAPKGINPSTTFIEFTKRRGAKAEPELVKAFFDAFRKEEEALIKAGKIDSKDKDPKGNNALLYYAKARDAKGRTALHYARNAEVQSVLMNIDMNDPKMKAGEHMYDIKDNDGKTFSEIPYSEKFSQMTPSNGLYEMQVADLSNVEPPTVSGLPREKTKPLL